MLEIFMEIIHINTIERLPTIGVTIVLVTFFNLIRLSLVKKNNINIIKLQNAVVDAAAIVL